MYQRILDKKIQPKHLVYIQLNIIICYHNYDECVEKYQYYIGTIEIIVCHNIGIASYFKCCNGYRVIADRIFIKSEVCILYIYIYM